MAFTLPVFLIAMVLPLLRCMRWLYTTQARKGKGQRAGDALRGVHAARKQQLFIMCPRIQAQVAGFPLDQLLKWGLTTPVQFWIGWRFHRGAYKALRSGRCAWARAVGRLC